MKFDVLLVSGARPSLLERTLESFKQNLFSNIEINSCFINIDPFEGGEAEVRECEKICDSYFENVVARKPENSNFTGAVRWLWSSPTTPWCVHLEDDWILNREITLGEIHQAMTRNVTQITFMTQEKNWKYRSKFHFKPNRKTIFGFDIGKGLNKKRPVFTTSPSLISSEFAKNCASMFDLNLDPEKQLNKLNKPLNDYTSQYKNRFIGSRDEHIAVDIGREHRDRIGLQKEVIEGQSFWTKKDT